MRFLLVLALLGAPAAAARSMFDSGQHCVAYKVKMRSLFSSKVVGKNCDVSVQLLPAVGGDYQIEVNVPISGFDSDDKERDKDVREILKEAEQSDIVFRSKTMTETEWREAIKKPSFVLEGELSIAGKSFPLTAPVEISKAEDGIEADGVITVPFSRFDLQPPKVGGGLFARAESDLELHFHLMSDKILGADKAVAPPVPAKE